VYDNFPGLTKGLHFSTNNKNGKLHTLGLMQKS